MNARPSSRASAVILATQLRQGLDRAEVVAPGMDRPAILRRFMDTLGRDDDAAVVATENLFFALRSSQEGPAFAALLRSGVLAPRPAAILLARVWHTGDTETLDVRRPQRIIVPLFRQARDRASDVLMDRGWPLFLALPSSFTVFRGSRRRLGDLHPSWTLDLECARVFARCGYGSEPGRVMAAEIAKRDALALFNVVGEREVVVDRRGLRNVRTVEDGVPAAPAGLSPLEALAAVGL